MKKILYIMLIALCLISMGLNIEWNKESIKAFVTGGVLMWLAMRFFNR